MRVSVCACVCVLAFNQNAQTAAQVIKFLLLQLGCRVVTSCMVNEEHANDLTCSGPTKAAIISAPQKRNKTRVYSPDMCAQQEDLKKRSRLSPGLDYFRFVVKYSVKLAGNAASLQLFSVSVLPRRLSGSKILSRSMTFLHSRLLHSCCCSATPPQNGEILFATIVMSLWCLVSVFTRDRNQALYFAAAPTVLFMGGGGLGSL